MKSFDETWEEIHKKQQWGKYPAESVIRFVARNYYNQERNKINILDFGCGNGSHTWYLAKEGFNTFAFDGSKSAIDQVKKRLESEGLKAELQVKDALELDYEKKFFDCVIDSVMIYANLYENIIKMYQNIYELLKIGGKLFSISFSKNTTGYGTGVKIEKDTFRDITKGSLEGRGMVHFFEKIELEDMLEQIGFHNIIIDTLTFSDRGNIVEQFLVSAEK